MTPADRPGYPITLNPLVQDVFEAPGIGLVHFTRDQAHSVLDLEMSSARVYALHFRRSAIG
jgi:hypothetical protein